MLARGGVPLVGATAAAYLFIVRPWHFRWRASAADNAIRAVPQGAVGKRCEAFGARVNQPPKPALHLTGGPALGLSVPSEGADGNESRQTQ